MHDVADQCNRPGPDTWKLEGAAAIGAGKRIATAFVGGVLARFGSRVAAGCTSGLGLSGGATLAVSAFVFLALFFVTGIVVSRIMPKGA